MSPSKPFGELEQINWASDQMNLDRTSEKLSHNDIRPCTNWTTQPPTFMIDEKPHSKLYIHLKEEQVIWMAVLGKK